MMMATLLKCDDATCRKESETMLATMMASQLKCNDATLRRKLENGSDNS